MHFKATGTPTVPPFYPDPELTLKQKYTCYHLQNELDPMVWLVLG